MHDGQVVILNGQAHQEPKQTTGDVIIKLSMHPHPTIRVCFLFFFFGINFLCREEELICISLKKFRFIKHFVDMNSFMSVQIEGLLRCDIFYFSYFFLDSI